MRKKDKKEKKEKRDKKRKELVTNVMQGERWNIKELKKVYAGLGFNRKQLQEIWLGLEEGIDVSWHARPE